MQLLVFISNHTDKMPTVAAELMKIGVRGATFLNCEGAIHTLQEADNQLPAFFSSMRSLFNNDYSQGKLMLAVMPDELIIPSKEIIKGICGDFSLPNTGILFTIPIMHFEGVSPKNHHE